MRPGHTIGPALGCALLALAHLALAEPAAGPTAGPTAVRPYVLSPDDQLDIAVLGHDDLKASVTILPDGTFNYPIAGPVHAAGLTVDGLRQTLIGRLGAQLNQPEVTVSVRESRPRKVSVLGAVKAPGLYDVKPGWHLLEALAACGGPAQPPELTQATLVTDGGRTTLPVDITALMAGGSAAQNLPLRAGDVLLVQPRDPSVAQVQVLGEVAKPGPYTVPVGGASVMAVLTEAGGATLKAALTRAQVMHAGAARVVNLRPLMDNAGDAAGTVRLVAGDVLLIPTSSAKVAVMGEVRSPAIYPIPDGETLSVTSALALAGGATSDGDKKSVDIVRHGPDGKTTVVAVNTDDLLKSGGPADTTLQPGDILYVPTRRKGHNAAELLNVLSPLSLVANLMR